MASLQIAKVESKDNNQETKPEIKPLIRTDKAAQDFSIDNTIKIKPIDKGNYVLIPSNLDETKQDNDSIISCLCISDTHGQHYEIEKKFNELPNADILIHSGDFTKIGHWGDIKSYDQWIKDLLNKHKKFKHCILIGGNHDITLDDEYYIKHGYNRFHAGNPQKEDITRYKDKCKKRAKRSSIYLQDESVTLFGVKILVLMG